jgi:Tfp pilus assembly protein PilO
MELMLWNTLLTIVVSFVGWVLKSKSDELQRIQILVNRTREEIAKEYVTKSEVHTDINRVLDRLDRLESKIDRMMESNRA